MRRFSSPSLACMTINIEEMQRGISRRGEVGREGPVDCRRWGMGETLICPECGEELEAKGRTAGQRFPCPWCRGQVVVPALTRPGLPRTLQRGKRLSTPRDRPLRK